MALTPEQITLVKACVPILAEHGKTVTTVFYKNMLGEHKDLNGVFNHTHQITGHQAQALACSVFAYAKYIDNLEVLLPAVEHIAQKHASVLIRPDQYAIVGGHLLAALKECLGEAFTQELHDAWAAAYWQLANIFINREKQLYAETNGWADWREFVLDKKVKESDEITSFYWKPKDGKALPTYKPGQYISVQTNVPHFEWKQSRQYSLSTSPNPEYYRISVKRESGLDINDPSASKNPGWISNILHNTFKVGDTIEMSHPAGDFFLDTKGKNPVVLLSAGVGITPLLSMLETLHAEKSERKISWIHGARSPSVQAFGDRVKELLKNNSNARIINFNGEAKDPTHIKGSVDLDKLNKENDLFLKDETTEYFICGPEPYMVATSKKLAEYGVDAKRIKYEVFSTGDLPQ